MRLTNSDLLAVEREYCSRSFRNFVKRAWPVIEPNTELKWGWALDAVCDHLDAVHNGDLKNLLINIPPGCLKSILVGVMFPAYEWGPKKSPHLRYLGTAHKLDLAIRDSMKCRRLIQSEWYQRLWPTTLTSDSNAKLRFENDKTGFREAMAFTSMTGSRGDRVELDDPLSVDGANSEAERLACERTFLEALPTRVNNDQSSIIIIMQRLHERDPSGIVIAKELNYEHLCLPMKFEADRRCTTSIGFKDPRRKDGELLFPERFGADQVAELEQTLGSYAAAGQLQQRPVPREGGLFKRSWFEIVSEAPADTQWVRGWDLAASEKKDSAFTAGVRVGRAADGTFYVGHSARGQLSPGKVENLIVNTASQDGQGVVIDIPQDPGQAGKAQVRYLGSKLAGYVVHFGSETGSKFQRAEPFAAQAEAGNVKIVKGAWNEAYLDELEVFPNGAFKDQVDATSRAFSRLIKPRVNDDFAGPILC